MTGQNVKLLFEWAIMLAVIAAAARIVATFDGTAARRPGIPRHPARVGEDPPQVPGVFDVRGGFVRPG